MTITNEITQAFRKTLISAEKSAATAEQYVRQITAMREYISGELTKDSLIKYKEHLQTKYAPASINAAISAINSFLGYVGMADNKLKTVKLQKQIYADSGSELKQEEYRAMLKAAENKPRLYMVLKTLAATGIRISELKFITVDAVEQKTAEIDCKGKHRTVILAEKLCRELKKYAKRLNITAGSIFITRGGKPIDRSNLAKELKRIAEIARVAKEKVFPHNFRHLFARTFYSAYKDIVRLADILGHSSIDTTRIYTRESGEIHRKQIEALGIV